MLEFGFPSGYRGEKVPAMDLANHSSGRKNPREIKKFLEKEQSHHAMIGPFKEKPFDQWFRNNPILTRPKRNSDSLRVILDLSFPEGKSVNSEIPRNELDGSQFKLKLPGPLDLAALIVSLGKGCHIYKIDLSRAYRQLRGDPLDWPLMGITWEGEHYVDLAVPFGLRHGASACQRTTEATAAIAADDYGSEVFPYVDDSAGGAEPEESQEHYDGLLQTCDDLGLDVALEKCQGSSTEMLWVGVWFNTIEMYMAIDRARVNEAIEQCGIFLYAGKVTLLDLQRLIGKLFHASKCTHSARAFLARLLDLLRRAGQVGMVQVTMEAALDARWFMAYLSAFNGKTMIKPTVAELVAEVDSCLQGGGGVCHGKGFYCVVYPEYLRGFGLSISGLEC